MFSLRSFVHQRLVLAAEEILGEVEKTITLALSDFTRQKEEPYPLSLLQITATESQLTNTDAALPAEATIVNPLIQEETHLDTPEAPGPSHTSAGAENSDGNQCLVQVNFEVKEEQVDELWEYSQTQTEGVLPYPPEFVTDHFDEPETHAFNELQPVSDFSEEGSNTGGVNGIREKPVQRKQYVKKGRRKIGRAKAALLKREAAAETPKEHRAGQSRRTCPVCGKDFYYMRSYVKHVKSHNGGVDNLGNLQGNHICEVCGKRLVNSKSLRNHYRLHTRIADFECQYCSKTFYMKQQLIVHTKSHTSDRPHACDICGKAYTQLSALNTHKKNHIEESPYRCDSCGRQFPTSDLLHIHMKCYLEGKPYSCDICGQNFCQRTLLVRHKDGHTTASFE